MSREHTKAAHYIQQLDEARCHGNWDVVPELLRKVKKHAPNRTCLALTVECELAIQDASSTRPTSSHPGTAATTTNPISTPTPSSHLARFAPLLAEAIGRERSYVEDGFQAEVCLGWLHWQLGHSELAVSALSSSIEKEFSQLDGTGKESTGWTRVCALKASYIKGTAQVRTGAVAEALETFESALPILSSDSSLSSQARELRSWTELFLTGFCMLSSHLLKSKITSTLETGALSAFRAWSKFWDSQASSPQGGRAIGADVPRSRVWKEYYVTLSDLLQQELPFPTTSLATVYVETSTRLQQRAELKRVESNYETLLLNEVQFPQAEQASEEVEVFVEIVMENWRVLCGSNWKEHALGEGGFEAVSRGVLDILYRAATKTFHSTPILRHLFAVHLAIAEFDLALRAFDTYLEIVKKGKARVEKTGVPEHNLDSDTIVLKTISECIEALCRYGTRQGAEKARELGSYLEEWLESHQLAGPSSGQSAASQNSMVSATKVNPETISLTWRSIGICHAQSARITYDAPSRGEMQLRAIRCFKRSLSPEYHCSKDLETLFALGTVLAERRELTAATEVIKAGLLPQANAMTKSMHGHGAQIGQFTRERKLIPLWHLMALLLSAKQEFLTAVKSCEGAFEQFQDPKYLFGEKDPGSPFRSEHLNERTFSQSSGLVDDMDDFEKESVLELKMTQLTLIEVLEGPEIAVNASDELLSLYSRLFGDAQKELSTSVAPGTAMPPKSAVGTTRSIRGSIFGRTGRSLRKANPTALTLDDVDESNDHRRPQTTQTVASTIAPTIQVTSDAGPVGPSASQKESHRHERLQKRNDSMSRKRSTNTRNRSSSAARAGQLKTINSRSRSPRRAVTALDGESSRLPLRESSQKVWTNETEQGGIGIAVAAASPSTDSHKMPSSKPLPPDSQQMEHKEKSLKPAHNNPSIAQDSRLPRVSRYSSSTGPITRFPKEQQRRRRIAILTNVWLLIGSFYRKAGLFEDSKAALGEAEKLVESLQSETLKDLGAPVSVQHAGWGGGKSVGELWGDIFSERGFLAVSENSPHKALENFESALTNFADHPSAIVGLSNLLLDIYTGDLTSLSATPTFIKPGKHQTVSASTINSPIASLNIQETSFNVNEHLSLPQMASAGPLGLPNPKLVPLSDVLQPAPTKISPSSQAVVSKEPSTLDLDRLAARDRAYGLLTGLTKLGSGWNNSEAWFALARAYEEGGQPEKAREVLWWCVELEDAKAVRSWTVVGSGGYVL
ncbi:TPR-like protein [Glarea lozoyensis ATCC 20868]|uniref:TPR-like protein n=1 Tax=Glarea lozoyensis (strain ATCC 20868 / MF5171) TaxID=1116229 RepID=S3CV02_GLAL2|nr:TPR-like protein [Glarea lozoyensis ATCC 20868]EPE30227.1 TPR-like protein [Glarea lozoyensis ATCC 20868]